MAQIKKVLCVCKGNSDRSPVMAKVLRMFLEKRFPGVTVESAGILEVAATGGPCSPHATFAAGRIGLVLVDHKRRWINNLGDLSDIDLFVVVDEEVANYVLGIIGHENRSRVMNVQINNPWPSEDQADHDETFQDVLAKMYKVVTRRFSAY